MPKIGEPLKLLAAAPPSDRGPASERTSSPTGQMDSTKTGAEAQKIEEKSPRERILQASLELFVEQGYFNTNVPDISRRSRCSVGSIYHHFLNKEEIAAQIFDAGMKDFRFALAQSIDLKQNAEANILNIVIAFMSFAEKNHLLARYLWLARHSEFLNQQVKIPTVVGFDELGRRVTRLLRKAEAEGAIAKLPAEVIWSLLFGLPLSYMRDWLDGYTRMPPSDVAPLLAQACWAALCGLKK